jgi:hypothetical protein
MNKEEIEGNWYFAETVNFLRGPKGEKRMDYSELTLSQLDAERARLSSRADELLDVVENPKASKQSFDQALAELTKTRKQLKELFDIRRTKKTY